MTTRTLVLDDVKERTVEDVLRDVALHRVPMTVSLSEGVAVTSSPSCELKPLPVLHGSVPQGWKDALY